MSTIFFVYASQELLQTYEELERYLAGVESIFPDSLFLKTQRAMLLYHSKGFLSLAKRWLGANRLNSSWTSRVNLLGDFKYGSASDWLSSPLLRHSLRPGCEAQACISSSGYDSDRQIPPGNLLRSGKLLLFKIRARKSSHVLPSCADARPKFPPCLDFDGSWVHGN